MPWGPKVSTDAAGELKCERAHVPGMTIQTPVGPIPTWVLIPAAVAVLVVVRAYFGSVIFAPRWSRAWNVARRVLSGPVQTAISQFTPLAIEVENESTWDEWVGVIEPTDEPLAVVVDGERSVEVPLLAGFKTAPDGETEHETFVWYYGARPWPSAPNWLRPKQVHVTTFRSGDEIAVYAHAEANSWRPDLFADHLRKGPSFSVAQGVQRADMALDAAGVEWIDRTYSDQPNPMGAQA